MNLVVDLHLHSKYSRAVSPQMTLLSLRESAIQKGIDVLAACDWTHPIWVKEMADQLEEISDGIYRIQHKYISYTPSLEKEALFLFSSEIATIYKQENKVRRIHQLVMVPTIDVALKINQTLLAKGYNLSSDGRPILGISSKNLLELILTIDERSMVMPCHIWTPHFGIYGSASGFNSLEECYGELSKYIYGIETGISSDPEMNWQVRELFNRSILSFSDAHSLPKMGREATVLLANTPVSKQTKIMNKTDICYEDIRSAFMRNKEGKLKIGYTYEFYPEEGKYHFSGHRNCGVFFSALEIKEKGNICPVCNKRLTEGVAYRIGELSDKSLQNRVSEKIDANKVKWYTDILKKQPDYIKLVPLNEIVAESLHATVASKKVQFLFERLCRELHSELYVLLEAKLDIIESIAGKRVAEGILKVRGGNIEILPGYDGKYGRVSMWKNETERGKGQLAMFEE